MLIRMKRFSKEQYKAEMMHPLAISVSVGIVLRCLCFYCFGESLASSVELSSPLVSYDLLKDGIALLQNGISPYAGDSVHIQPVLLHFFSLLSSLPHEYVFAVFVMMDTITAYLLFKATSHLTPKTDFSYANVVAQCFLYNPITISSCTVCSLSVLNNLLLALFVWSFTIGSLVLTSVVLATVVHLSLYPLILIASVFLRFPLRAERIRSIFIITALFIAFGLINFVINGFNWNYLEDTYLFMYYVDDLTPNTGIFWYFFTQVFEHFRYFYISVFQINLLVYMVPLFLTLKNDNHLHMIISMLLIAVFSPYPTLNDAAVYMALLPTLEKYWKEPMRYVLPISGAVVTCAVLMPVMWHMWIVNGSGNANFYFGATIIYNLSQIYLLGDLLFAYFRKEAISVAGDFVTEKTSFIFH